MKSQILFTMKSKIALTVTIMFFLAAGTGWATPLQAIDLNNAAVAAINAGKFQQAIDKLLAALKLDPSYTLARKNLGIAYNNYALCLAKSDLKHAIRLFHLALYVDPNESTKANLNERIKRLHKDPKSYSARVQLAEQARSEGDMAGAIVEYREALAIKESQETRKKLNALPRPSNLPEMNAVKTSSSASNGVMRAAHDYRAYLQSQIKHSWHPPVDYREGTVKVLFTINQRGEVRNLKIEQSSTPNEGKAALEAVKKASPFKVPPKSILDDKGSLDISFDFNKYPGYGNPKLTKKEIAHKMEELAETERAFGANSPESAFAALILADCYREHREYAPAEPLYKRAIAAFNNGTAEADRISALSGLAELYYVQNQYAQAEPLYKEALILLEKHPKSQKLVDVLEQYAKLLYKSGRTAEADVLYARIRQFKSH